MRRATITEAKNGLSGLIDQVKAGQSIVILDRGIPVARLEPMVGADGAEGRIERLERAGLIRRGVAAPPVDLIMQPGPAAAAGHSVLDALLEERREGR
jgi:prevent-host-death family protein